MSQIVSDVFGKRKCDRYFLWLGGPQRGYVLYCVMRLRNEERGRHCTGWATCNGETQPEQGGRQTAGEIPMEKLMTRFEKATEELEKEAESAKQANMLESVLHKNRTLTLFGEINQDVARKTAEKLLALAFESDDPITLYIGSPGGHVESGDTIYDMIQFIKPVVRIVGTGWVGSIATHIYLAAEKEHRYANASAASCEER